MARGGKMSRNFRVTGGACYRRETWSVVGTGFFIISTLCPCVVADKMCTWYIIIFVGCLVSAGLWLDDNYTLKLWIGFVYV